ncbi:hypothetical protein EXIGLDRAFT_846526 [Exidia glandulosa HHB12029]|uniref:Uncharacterized protein n=1 Tax=Exidia glandulosa HHB12029 TaxID=1314781 RepID=A0A165AVL8_EXIGL|nr:hypothetical protein EXIGLDRAFT_846526 [Exidia glandulosa HHB12029]
MTLTMLSHPTVAYSGNSISSPRRVHDPSLSAAGSLRHQQSNRRTTPVNISIRRLITIVDNWDDIPLKDLSPDYDAVVVDDDPDGPCFAGPSCPTSRNIRVEYVAAVKERTARGQVFYQAITSHFETWNSSDTSRLESRIEQYGYNGIMITEDGSSVMGDEDSDIGNPTTPALVNFISAMKSIKTKYGDGIVFGFMFRTVPLLTERDGILAIIYALREDSTILCPIDHASTLDTDAWVNGNNLLRGGFPVNDQTPFPSFDNHQIVLLMSDQSELWPLQSAIDCITGLVRCNNTYPFGGPSGRFGGVMLGSANETINAPIRTVLRPQLDQIKTQDDDFWKTKIIAAVAVPAAVVFCTIIAVAAVWLRRRHQRRRPGHRGSEVRPYGASAVPGRATSDHTGSAKLARLEGALKGADTLPLLTVVPSTPGSPEATIAEPGGLHGPEHPRIVALQTEMSRVGFSVDALLASLSRLRTPAVIPTPDAESDDIRSDAPPPTYGTSS